MSIPLLLAKRGFHPRQLFSALQGAWLEPVVGNIWQENTGVTPTTTGGQTIGLMLDQSQGAVLGPELVTNGDFSNGTTGWTTAVNASVSGGEGKFTNAVFADGSVIAQNIQTIAGKTYQIQFTVSNYSSGTLRLDKVGLSGLVPDITANGTYTARYTALSTNSQAFQFSQQFGAGNLSVSIDNISVRQVLGNHAYQATAANRPTYQLVDNRPLVRHDATDTLTCSLPNLGGGVFSSAGSVYFATPVGMSALHNQSMGTTYTLPALSSDIYSWIVVQQRLSAVQESRLSRYMRQRAGIAEDDYLWESFRRNLLTWSEDCSKAEWFKIGTLSLSSEIAPNGNAAYLLTETTATDSFTLGRNAFTVGIGTALTVTYFIKANNATRTFLVAPQGTGGHTKGIMVGNDGAYLGEYAGTGTITSYVITVLPNSWLKVSISWTSQMNDAYPFVRLLSGGTTPYIGDGTSGFYVGGFQLERGSVATPYQRIDAGPDPYTIVQDQLTAADGTELLLAQ